MFIGFGPVLTQFHIYKSYASFLNGSFVFWDGHCQYLKLRYIFFMILHYTYWQTLLPDRQINFSIHSIHCKDLFKFFFGFGVTVITLNE